MQFIATFSDAIISETKNMFSIFFTFSEFQFNVEHFQKSVDSQSCCIFELADSKKRGQINF